LDGLFGVLGVVGGVLHHVLPLSEESHIAVPAFADTQGKSPATFLPTTVAGYFL